MLAIRTRMGYWSLDARCWMRKAAHGSWLIAHGRKPVRRERKVPFNVQCPTFKKQIPDGEMGDENLILPVDEVDDHFCHNLFLFRPAFGDH